MGLRPEQSLPVYTGRIDKAPNHFLIIDGKTLGENGGVKNTKNKEG